MKLSVIVPVYNVEKFLPRCLDSLLRQGLEVGEYEVICVNDGSPDGSAAILAEYERKHPEVFKVITQENRGSGAARNVGLKVAQGEYIGFLDTDDYVVDDAFRYLYDHFCKEQKPDVLQFQYKEVFTDGVTLVDPDAKPDGEILFDGDGVVEYNKKGDPTVWNKFFRHQFLLDHSLEFEAVAFEDNLFNFSVFRLHPRLVIVSCNVNRYEQGNSGSTMQTLDKGCVLAQLDDLIYLMVLMYRYLDSEEAPDLAPAAWLNLKMFHSNYNSKLCRIGLTHGEWSHYALKLYPDGVALLKKETSPTFLGRTIQWLKIKSLRSYLVYCFTHWLLTLWLKSSARKQILHR